MTGTMEYKNYTFKNVKYKNDPERDPLVSLKYTAESLDDGKPKKSKDKFDDLPQKGFRKVWKKLLHHWKLNLEMILGDIDWSYESIRLQQVKIKWENGKPVAVQYRAKVATGFDEKAIIPTPHMQPSMQEGEIDALKDLCNYAEEFLHGARDQGDLFNDSSEDNGEDVENKPEPQEEVESESEDRDTNLDELF